MNRFKVETKRYKAIEFYIKSESVCKSCLNVMIDGYNWHSISISDVDQWEKITLSFKDLGVSDNASFIESFMFQGSSQESRVIYFDKIELVKSDYIDGGTCADPDDDENDNNFSNIVNIPYLFLSIYIINLLLLY